MTEQEVLQLATQLMQHNEAGADLIKQGWTPVINVRGKSFLGRCHYDKKQIEITRHWIPVLNDREIRDVILHEIAHALTPGDGHGKHWKYVAMELGANPKATAKIPLDRQPDPKYVIVYRGENGVERLGNRQRKVNLAGKQVKGRPETMNKLELITFEEYKCLSQ